MRNEIKTICEQIDYKELAFAGFKFVYDDKDLSLVVHKGQKQIKISLNSWDLYDVEKIKITPLNQVLEGKPHYTSDKLTGIYGDQLKEIIQEFFPRFEYVFRKLGVY